MTVELHLSVVLLMALFVLKGMIKFIYMLLCAVWAIKYKRDTFKGAYGFNLWKSYDQHWNTIFAGDPDRTISARAYANRDKKKRWYLLNTFMDLVDTGHGKKAFQSDPREGKDAAARFFDNMSEKK